MKITTILLGFFLTSCWTFSQKDDPTSKHDYFIGNWTLTEGWFPIENLTFVKTSKADAYLTFVFEEGGNLSYPYYSKGKCPVGEFTIKDGHWKWDRGYLTLELRGLKISDYWYWYIIKYKVVKSNERTLNLEVAEIIKDKKIRPTLTWNDLLKDS